MKHEAPPFLAKDRLASTLLAIVLFGLEVVQLLLVLVLLLVRVRKADPSLDWLLWPAVGALGLNTWALARTVKTGHFLWLYGRWPALELSPDAGQEQGQVLAAARHAFFEGEFARVPGLLARLEGPKVGEALALGLGRSLALDGRTEEAEAAFRAAGLVDEEGCRRLQPPRFLGIKVGSAPYFGPQDAAWSKRVGLLLGLGLALLLLNLGQVSIVYQHAQASLDKLIPGFDSSDFTVETAGRFTLHYHDREFRDLVLPVAEDALEHHLAFLGLPADAFGPGQIHFYLCDSREEYVRRAPQTPAWEAASAMPRDNAIYLYRMDPSQKVYFEVVVAHELCHLVYHKLVPLGRQDSWLNEGLAEHMGFRFAFERAGIARHAWLMNKSFLGLREQAMPFKLFFSTDPHDLPDPAQVGVFYKQGFSVVFVLLENFGREPFLAFLKVYGAEPDMDKALKRAYPSIRDVDELSSVWGLFFPKAERAPGT